MQGKALFFLLVMQQSVNKYKWLVDYLTHYCITELHYQFSFFFFFQLMLRILSLRGVFFHFFSCLVKSLASTISHPPPQTNRKFSFSSFHRFTPFSRPLPLPLPLHSNQLNGIDWGYVTHFSLLFPLETMMKIPLWKACWGILHFSLVYCVFFYL